MLNLPPLEIRYPYDPTGKSPDNFVEGEKHTLPPVNNRIIVPRLGAFYADSLEVDTIDRKLVKGKDYELAAIYHDATVETGKDVNVMIYFNNPELTGDVYIHYQVVGGKFTGVWESIQKYVNVLLVDPRKVRWDDIANKPELYAPKEHFHDINDVYGLNHLIPKLEEMIQAILKIRAKGFTKVYDVLLRVKKDVDEMVNDANKLLGNANSSMNLLSQELNNEKQKIIQLTERISNLENDQSIRQELSQLKQADRTLNNELQTIKDKYTQLKEASDNLSNELTRVKNKVDDLSGKHDKLSTKVIGLENNLQTLERETDRKLSEKADLVKNATQDYYRTHGIKDGFLSGRWNTAVSALPKIPSGGRHVGERNFAGWEVNKEGLVLSHISFGVGEHYLYTSADHGNGIESNTEKIITDWSLMNDPKVQNLLLDTVINESRIKYVDSINGNDDTGNGTWQKPYRTFLKAFEELTPSNKAGIIRLAEGQTHTATNKKASDWLMFRMRLPLLVIESYGSRSNRRIGYTGTTSKPYTNKIWNGFTNYNDNGVETILLFTNGSNQDRSNYIFDGYYNKYMIYFMGIHVKLDQNADRDTYSKGLSLTGVVGDAYIYSYLSRFSLLKEHTYLLTKSYTGRENGIYFEEFRNNQGQAELSVRGLGKIFKPHITSNINDDNQYNYNGLNIHTDHPSLYTDEILERYIPKLKHGRLTWNSNINTNISRSNKLDPSLLPLSKNRGNLLSVRDDGIYYGIEAPPNTSVVYVDAINGLDTNPGTRALPFKTFRKAWDLDIESGVRTIYLHERQTHLLNGSPLNVKGKITRNIYTYGPEVDAHYRRNTGWYGDSSRELPAIETIFEYKSDYSWKDPVTKKRFVNDKLVNVYKNDYLFLEFKGLIIKKHSSSHIEKIRDGIVEDGYTWTYSSNRGWGYHNDGLIDFRFFNCKIQFVNDWVENDRYKYKDFNCLLNGRTDTTLDFIATTSGSITGEGRFCYLVQPGVKIKSLNSISDEEYRKYFYNFKNTSVLLEIETDNDIRIKRVLPLHDEQTRFKRSIRFEDADQSWKVYFGSQESTYTTGDLQFSYTTNKFKFTKPVMNERNQVLGVSNTPNNLIKHNDSGLILTKQDLYNALVEMGLTPPRRPN